MSTNESLICQYKKCRKVYEEPLILLCCGESICAHHVDDLIVDKLKKYQKVIKCCYCKTKFTLPEQGLPPNRIIQKLLTLDSGELATRSKISLNEYNKKIFKLDSLKKDPDAFIEAYFNRIRSEVQIKRQEILDYYDHVLSQVDTYEIDSKKNKKTYNYALNGEIEKFQQKYRNWNEELNSDSGDEIRLKRLNREIDETVTEIDGRIRQIQFGLTDNKSYEFKRSYRAIDEDYFGKIVVHKDYLIRDFDFLSSSEDKTIKLWNPDNGQCLRTITGHTASIYCVKILSKDKFISSSLDKTIKLWNLISGECIKSFNHKDSLFYHLVRINDDEFASGNDSGCIHIWHINRDYPLKTLKGHSNAISGLIYVRERDQLISCCRFQQIRIWNVNSADCVKTIEGKKNEIAGIKLLPNLNDLIVCSDEGKIRKFNLKTSSCIKLYQAHSEPVKALELISFDKIATGSNDKTIKIWDINTNTCLTTLSGHKDRVVSLKMLANNKLISGSCDQTIKIWDLDTYQCVKTLEGHTSCVHSFDLIEKAKF